MQSVSDSVLGENGNFEKSMKLLYDIVLCAGGENGFDESVVEIEKKNIKDAFDILYVNKLGNELTVLKSNISEGIPYQPQKSKVAKNVKQEHQKKALSEIAFNSFLFIFALPAYLIYAELKDNENKKRSAREGNFTMFACIAWSYLICSVLTTLVFYMAGMKEGYWKWGFIVGILPCILICLFLATINWKKLLK